jgi:CDP-alcohol phosphatidyltransferase
MPEHDDESHSRLEATYKAREVEGILDLYFYRPIGFQLAESFQKFKVTPATVTWLAGFFGIVAGHLYFYRNLRVNILGMALHVCANALDNADGQLARLTHRETREGRIIDSIADHLVFFSVYLHLTLRYFLAGASPAIFLLALAAGISHALQGAAADYYRSTYLYFRTTPAVPQLDSSSRLRADDRELSWHREPRRKLLLGLYLNFTRQQEILAPHLKKLRDLIGQLFQGEIPNWLRTRYRNLASPDLKWWGLLMTNTRMLALFAFLLIGVPIYYFWFELILLNLLLVYLLARQEHMAESLLEVTEQWGNSV